LCPFYVRSVVAAYVVLVASVADVASQGVDLIEKDSLKPLPSPFPYWPSQQSIGLRVIHLLDTGIATVRCFFVYNRKNKRHFFHGVSFYLETVYTVFVLSKQI